MLGLLRPLPALAPDSHHMGLFTGHRQIVSVVVDVRSSSHGTRCRPIFFRVSPSSEQPTPTVHGRLPSAFQPEDGSAAVSCMVDSIPEMKTSPPEAEMKTKARLSTLSHLAQLARAPPPAPFGICWLLQAPQRDNHRFHHNGRIQIRNSRLRPGCNLRDNELSRSARQGERRRSKPCRASGRSGSPGREPWRRSCRPSRRRST